MLRTVVTEPAHAADSMAVAVFAFPESAARIEVASAIADGSVRFISENIDPTILERLSKMPDLQTIPNF